MRCSGSDRIDLQLSQLGSAQLGKSKLEPITKTALKTANNTHVPLRFSYFPTALRLNEFLSYLQNESVQAAAAMQKFEIINEK